jgi:hypothetical protein
MIAELIKLPFDSPKLLSLLLERCPCILCSILTVLSILHKPTSIKSHDTLHRIVTCHMHMIEDEL